VRIALVVLLVAIGTGVRARGADFSQVPGTVIDHSPQSSGVYLGTPGVAILGDGALIAKCDEFGPNSTETTGGVTQVFRSDDHGRTWRRIATVGGLYWSNVFLHRDALYMIGVTKVLGDAVICRSTDGGASWTIPRDPHSGLLRPGRFHTSATPAIVHGGRLWRAMETFDQNPTDMWHAHRPVMLSASADSDLLEARNWTFSEPAARGADWLGGQWSTWLEGNAVVDPAGKLIDLLRCDYRVSGHEKAMWVDVSEDGRSLSFDPRSGFIEFPGGCKKFTVRYDDRSRLYWSLANYVPQRHWDLVPERARNTSVLMCSSDLRRWEARCVLLYGSDFSHEGFQYADFVFDGDDLAAAYRTSFPDGMGGAHNQHDSNLITFHRIAHFRTLTPRDSIAPWLAEDLERYNGRLGR
jgi:hypothetical protein